MPILVVILTISGVFYVIKILIVVIDETWGTSVSNVLFKIFSDILINIIVVITKNYCLFFESLGLLCFIFFNFALLQIHLRLIFIIIMIIIIIIFFIFFIESITIPVIADRLILFQKVFILNFEGLYLIFLYLLQYSLIWGSMTTCKNQYFFKIHIMYPDCLFGAIKLHFSISTSPNQAIFRHFFVWCSAISPLLYPLIFNR